MTVQRNDLMTAKPNDPSSYLRITIRLFQGYQFFDTADALPTETALLCHVAACLYVPPPKTLRQRGPDETFG